MTTPPARPARSSNRKWLWIALSAVVVLVVIVVVVVISSQRSAQGKEQAEFACVNLDVANSRGGGLVEPYGFTIDQLQEKYGLSAGDAADRIDAALDDTCPQLRGLSPR